MARTHRFPPTVSSSPDTTHNTNVEQFEFDAGTMKDRALQQEIELARLEQELVVLRRMLGLELRETQVLSDSWLFLGDLIPFNAHIALSRKRGRGTVGLLTRDFDERWFAQHYLRK